jgi:hypothetical protein
MQIGKLTPGQYKGLLNTKRGEVDHEDARKIDRQTPLIQSGITRF